MPFWESKNTEPSPSLNAAVGCLAAYAIVSAGYLGWLAATVGFNPLELGITVIRVGVSSAVGWVLWKRAPWARMVGLGLGGFGAMGLVALGMALADIGAEKVEIGGVTAVFAGVSALFLVVSGIFLAREDAKAAFEPVKVGAFLAP